MLTTVAVVPRAQASSSRPAIAFVTPVTVPVQKIPRRINSLGQEEELTEIDDDDIPPRCRRWGERRHAESILQPPRNIMSRLRYVSECIVREWKNVNLIEGGFQTRIPNPILSQIIEKNRNYVE